MFLYIFILYINLFLESLFTCKHRVILQFKSHHCFWQYLCYKIIDNQVVIVGLGAHCNALRHSNFQTIAKSKNDLIRIKIIATKSISSDVI